MKCQKYKEECSSCRNYCREETPVVAEEAQLKLHQSRMTAPADETLLPKLWKKQPMYQKLWLMNLILQRC
jgi:hypothetical protein